MRLSTGLVRPRGWPSLRRVFLATLALVVALAGGASLRQAQAQETVERMTVYFSRSTPPIAPGVICKDQDYQIVVIPLRRLPLPSVAPRRLPPLHSIVLSLTRPDLGTLNGGLGPAGRYTSGGVAVFTYRAQQTGQEKLNFGWTNFIRPDVIGRLRSYEDIDAQVTITGDTEFTFEVRECVYKVSLIYRWHYSVGGATYIHYGRMEEAQLGRKNDGTFEGNGRFVVNIFEFVPECIISGSDLETQPRITGKLLPDSRKLELTLDYGKGTRQSSASCPRVPVVTREDTIDMSMIGVPTAKFPQVGGSKSFPLAMPGNGKLTITVAQVVAE